MGHSTTFIKAEATILVESGSYSKCPGVFLSHMRWFGIAISNFEPVLLDLSKYVYTYLNTSSKGWIFANWSNGRLSFIQNSMQDPVFGCVSSLRFSLISGFHVCQQLHSSLFVGTRTFSLWQLCSLRRIISLPQAVVIGWILKLFWRKEALPAWRQRWKRNPLGAERGHRDASCTARSGSRRPAMLTENLTASAFPDLDHLSHIHFLAYVTTTRVKAISKYLATQFYSPQSSDSWLHFPLFPACFNMTPPVIEMCVSCIKKQLL